MTNIIGKVVLITGASSGIGEATARHLAKGGAHVVLGARREEKLKSLVSSIAAEGGTAEYMKLDVTQEVEMQQFIHHAKSKFGKIDVIINNAGVMPLSKLEALNIDEWNEMIDVNIRGVLHGIVAGLPIMKEQGFGHFMNISSIGGHAVTPTAAVYCATKYAVIAISEGLRMESEGSLRVTVVSPGVTESELADSITDPVARQAMDTFRKISISPDAIAHAIQYAMEQPSEVDVNEIIIRPTASTL
ncbi:NADP-dependent 3-hydroxy acid dehydrogenase YdfG [Evansella caseinilytica]|uniref:NADP-dependent 3-hydroxy acid dehydrogenase YdfG n=1 Tax=Evansella caseinilytica TaxID=1503961 RepID=A0A1H3TU47_9BACI|nr:SDR family oxidoreductase [Evansella caseinilytica]SDZ53311.1 NADP-dependent 3-hydroxy acid dehydrogenase YdfG [Evansella caseinilytica]